jgi:hypothetical protein
MPDLLLPWISELWETAMTDEFISYSRKDQGFVRRLFDALKAQSRGSWVD